MQTIYDSIAMFITKNISEFDFSLSNTTFKSKSVCCIHGPLLASRHTSAGQSFSLCTITRSSNLTVLATCSRIVMPSMSYCRIQGLSISRCNVDSTWTPREHHEVITWMSRGYHVDFTCLARGYHVDFTCLARGYHVGFTWLSRGYHVVITWMSRGLYVFSTWLSRGCHVDFTCLALSTLSRD
jgi:hypothetical protein